MATRATYQFKPVEEGYKPPIATFYIHHDGYPSGAVEYIEKATSIEEFFRKNEGAKIVYPSRHETHSDTEYRYTIGTVRNTKWTGNLITVSKRYYPGDVGFSRAVGYGDNKWDTIFAGTVAAFIEKYTKETTVELIMGQGVITKVNRMAKED